MAIKPPSPPYVGPPRWKGSSNNKPIKRVVIHCTAGAEPGQAGAARSTAAYTKSTSRPSSWHYCADSKESVQLTYDSVVAYHDGTNSNSIGYELSCSLSSEGKGHWERADHQAMLKIAAEDVARLCLAYDVPIVKLTPAEVRAGKKGLCGHVDMRSAFPGSTSHWDPGPYFPWAQFIGLVKAAAERLTKEPAKPEPTARPTVKVKAAFIPMQFSDTPAQMRADAGKIFRRANRRNFWWVAGTEADEGMAKILREAADVNGFRFHRARGEWVAVRKEHVRGGWKTGYAPAFESHHGKGKHSDRGVAWAGFDTKNLGRITVGSAHFLTDGRRKGQPNWEWNKRLTDVIGEWGKEHGKQSALVFICADFNRNDRTDDVFNGQPFTTAADEIGKHPNTGHGPIDGIASYDKDKRVEAVRWDALSDAEFDLETDHYFTVAVFEVRELAS